MYIPIASTKQAPHKSESQFSASYWAPFLTLFTVNGLSVALLMRSLALCNQVLSELRRVHFTGSQGTRSNQNAVFSPPPSAITPPLLFYHCCAVIQSWRRAGTREQTNKHADRGWNHGGITEPEAHSLPAFSFSVKWKPTTHKSEALWNVQSVHFQLRTACFSHAVAFCFQIAHSIHQTRVTHR